MHYLRLWQNRLSVEQFQWVLIGTVSLLALLCLYTSYAQIHPWVTAFTDTSPKKTKVKKATLPPSPQQLLKDVDRWALFGKPPSEAVQAAKNGDFTLLGILMAPKPENRRAIIKVKGKDEVLLKVGEKLNGASLIEVQQDQVILQGAKGRIALPLEFEKAKKKKSSSRKTRIQSRVRPEPRPTTTRKRRTRAKQQPNTDAQRERFLEQLKGRGIDSGFDLESLRNRFRQ